MGNGGQRIASAALGRQLFFLSTDKISTILSLVFARSDIYYHCHSVLLRITELFSFWVRFLTAFASYHRSLLYAFPQIHLN